MMNLPPKKIEPNLAYLDPFLMDRIRINAGMSRKKLATEATLAVNTVLDAFNCGGLQPFKAKLLAQTLGCQVTELLAPWDPLYKVPANPPGPWSGSPEWEPIGYLEQGRLAPNGLYYVVFRMQHRHTTAKSGRGKFYHLSWLPPAKREGMRHQLSRHADVCARVGVHPHIVVNHTSTPVANDEGWWVIDDWVGETTLANHIKGEPWPLEELPRLLLEIARGLEALHQADVVFRELAPARVLMADKGGRAVLTDFELAKLLDGGPSVSSEWPEDPFRAPEVEGGTVAEGADLYSLAMVAAAAIAGPAFDPGHAVTILKASSVPKRALHLLVDCLKPLDHRPSELTLLLKELARWAEG
jgi:hypothetical protein